MQHGLYKNVQHSSWWDRHSKCNSFEHNVSDNKSQLLLLIDTINTLQTLGNIISRWIPEILPRLFESTKILFGKIRANNLLCNWLIRTELVQRRNWQLQPAKHTSKWHLQVCELVRRQNSLCNLIMKANTVQSMLLRLSTTVPIIHT